MEQVYRVVLSPLDYDGDGKILEVGCGSGALAIRAALIWPKAKVIGVDYWGAVYNYSKVLCEKKCGDHIRSAFSPYFYRNVRRSCHGSFRRAFTGCDEKSAG